MTKPLSVSCLALLLLVPAFAQRGTGGGKSTPPPRTRIPSIDITPSTTVFLSGKVVVDDGSALTESASIQTICRGQKNTETHTDSRGNFSFQFGSRSNMSVGTEYDADSPIRSSPGRPERRTLQDCELQASLAGFTSDVVQLGGRFTGDESADIGRIVLHRLANVAGFTISATTAQAPPQAKKAFEKGQQQAKSNKWDDAEKSFQKAVTIYPKFAVAWFELGLVQMHKDMLAGARNSFQQSIAADTKYVSPYRALSQIALRDRNWREVIDLTEKITALNPVNFPEAWFANSAGHLSLGEYSAAEKSARRGLEIDVEHHIPRLHYLLGLALLRKPDYREAAQHMRAFMEQATKAEDKAEAQKQLDDIARLSASATPVPKDN